MDSKGDLVVGNECLQNLKSHIAAKWKDVGRRLGLTDERLHNLEKERRFEGQEDVCYGMLCAWKQEVGKNPTYKVLAKALRLAGRTDLAEDLLAGKFDGDTASTDNTSRASPEAAGLSDTPTQRAAAPPPAVPSTVLPSPANPLPRYNMGNKPRGNCLILTYDEFHQDKLAPRPGNAVDKENLIKTFEELDFCVIHRTNLNKENSMKVIREMAGQKSDSFVLFVCSHGNEKSFFTSDNEEIALQEVISPFNADKSKGLLHKPKMFFFNSCRGIKKEEMAKADDAESHLENVGVVSNLTYYRPTQADFFVVLSTVPGFVSWSYLDSKKGSYFVRNLITSMTENYQKHHLYDILTITNDKLLRNFEEIRISTGRSDSICQVPTIISTLTKAVYFVD